MGRRYLAVALGLNTASVVNAAALLLFAASLLSYFIPFDIAITLSASVVLAYFNHFTRWAFEGLDNIARNLNGRACCGDCRRIRGSTKQLFCFAAPAVARFAWRSLH